MSNDSLNTSLNDVFKMTPMGPVDNAIGSVFYGLNQEIQIQFRCMGACYQDDIIVHEFNKTVGIFNPGMRKEYVGTSMQKVPYNALQIFNNQGYPRIDPDTYELEWYVSKANYNRVMNAYQKHIDNLDGAVGNNSSDTGVNTGALLNKASSVESAFSSASSVVDKIKKLF